MRILLTNLTLATRTGTEIVTRDLALALKRAGHEPCVFTPYPGAIAQEIVDGGVPVAAAIEDVPFRPDIIHGHHHVETTLALLHFPGTPAIFVCHDRLNWHDTPPRLDAVRRYVAVDRNCLERLILEAAIPERQTRMIPNAVDLRRFIHRRDLPARPERALVFSNYARKGTQLDPVRQACAEEGLSLDVAGSSSGAPVDRPEKFLGHYDLVFAKGRCALEAMATGCAVLLCDFQGLGLLVSSGRVSELREWNFGMRCLTSPLNVKSIREEMERYDAADAARVRNFIRGNASLDAAVAQYVDLYQEVLAEAAAVSIRVSPGQAVRKLAEQVGWLESRLRAAGEPLAMPPLPRGVGRQIHLELQDAPRRLTAGSKARLRVEIENSSNEVLASVPPYPVQYCYHWLEAGTKRCIEFDGLRTELSIAVRPRTRHSQEVSVLAPAAPGRYLLQITLVQEHRFWFDELPEPVTVEREVTIDDGEHREEVTLSQLAASVSLNVLRDGSFINLGFLSGPQERMLTFVEHQRFVDAAIRSAGVECVLTIPELSGEFPRRMAVAVTQDPKRLFFEIHNYLATETEFYGRDFASVIDQSAQLHPRCWVDEKNVVIGPGVIIGPNASVVGRVQVGAGTVIQAGAVIGASGFQTSSRAHAPVELVHAGGVEIDGGCHIFANAVIARGLFRQNTRIGAGTRVGNGAFISHNCVLGDVVFVGHGAVLNGNIRVGSRAWIGPGSTIVHGIAIGEAAQISLGATVVRDVEPGKRVTGSLAIEHFKMLRMMSAADKGKSR
ncbi:MAG TPA: glycosyltransferase [Bryobacteraceae bacterium]|nr:glycosyltransferase [Bryobacteraceae bacterium]